MPFLAEEMYQNLVRGVQADAPLSVHMASWPEVDAAAVDDDLVAAMDVVQKVVGLGRAARAESKLRVRQPLSRVLVRVPDEAAQEACRAHEQEVLEELNVKALELIAPDAKLVSYRVKPNLPRIGKRYGKLVPAIKQALAEADGGAIAEAAAQGESFEITVDGQTLTFAPEDVLIETASAEGYASAEEGGYLVALDTRLTPELEREGLARELVRTVQDARKQAGLDVQDRIRLRITGGDAVREALQAHGGFIQAETLTAEWAEDGDFTPQYSVERTVDTESWRIELAKAS